MKPPADRDLEVYAFTQDEAAVLAALGRVLGPLRAGAASSPGPARHEAGGAVVLLQPSEDASLGVWLRGSDAWPTSAALGRYLVRALGCEVRCEPEPAHRVDPHSSVFLRITPAGEDLVHWG